METPVKDKGGGGRRQEERADHDAGLTPVKGERKREPHFAGWVWGTPSQTNGEAPGKAATGRNSVASGSRALPASVMSGRARAGRGLETERGLGACWIEAAAAGVVPSALAAGSPEGGLERRTPVDAAEDF